MPSSSEARTGAQGEAQQGTTQQGARDRGYAHVRRRSVTLRVDVDIPSTRRSGVLEISGTDARLTDDQARAIQLVKMGDLRRSGLEVFSSPTDAVDAWVSRISWAFVDSDNSDALHQFLPGLLRSEEALVPRFNSPPSEWTPLRSALEQASAIGVGVTLSEGSVPALVGAYIGGLFLVKFVTPIATEVGNATADGIGLKIRRAFGVDQGIPQQSDGSVDETPRTQGRPSAEGSESDGPT